MAVKKKSSFWQKIKKILFWIWFLNLIYIVITKWINPPFTTVMISAMANGYSLKRDYVNLNEMSKHVKLAVICSEDQLFPEHNGFDFDAIKKAMAYNENPKHKKTIGASTISQQTAKNVFLWNGRNWIRKGLEVYHTFLIELIWRKKRILETYLNVAEMGKGIFGIQAASQHYYKKSASQLNASEAAWIATILPNPVKYDIHHPNAWMVKKHKWILTQMSHLREDKSVQSLIHLN